MWKVTLVSVFWVSLGARLAEVERKTPESDEKELADVPTTESPGEASQEKDEVVVNFTKDAKPGVELGSGDRKGTMLREHEAGTIISQIEPGGFLADNADKGPFKNWHVVKIGKRDVSHVGPMTVQSLWVEAMHSHKPYTVIFDREIGDLEHRSVLYVGAFPALLALIVTCCALPPFLCSIWRGTALANPRPPEMEIDDGLEEAPQLARPCYLADAVDHPVTRYTLMFFFLFSLFDSIRLSIDFIFLRPLVAYIHISDAALVLSMSIVLEFGRRATQQNPLIFDPPESVSKDKAMTMSEKLVQRLPKLYKQKAKYARCEAGLTEVLTKELKYGMYLCLPTVLMCFFVAGHGIVIIAIAIYIESRGFKGGMDVGAVVCSDICYFCLLRLCILKFMLDNYIVSSVARISVDTAVAKLQHLVEKLCGQGDEDEQETSPQTLQKDVEEAVVEVHLCAVDLAERVLPALQKIGASALGFAVVSWAYSFTWVFSFLANDVDSVMKRPWYLVSEVLGIMLTSLPLGLMCLIPPASVSDACDNLLKQMNKLRSFETIDDLSLRKTERFIKEANGGQGLGFVLWGTGTVVNRKLLFSVFLKIFALASVLVGSINTLMKLQSNLQKELKTVEQIGANSSGMLR